MQGAVIFQISLHFHVIMKGRPLNIVVMKHRFLNVVFTPKKEGITYKTSIREIETLPANSSLTKSIDYKARRQTNKQHGTTTSIKRAIQDCIRARLEEGQRLIRS